MHEYNVILYTKKKTHNSFLAVLGLYFLAVLGLYFCQLGLIEQLFAEALHKLSFIFVFPIQILAKQGYFQTSNLQTHFSAGKQDPDFPEHCACCSDSEVNREVPVDRHLWAVARGDNKEKRKEGL